MPESNNKDPLRNVIGLFKDGYNAPTKAFVWAKALNEWWRFGIGGAALVFACLIFLFPALVGIQKKHAAMDYAARNVASQLNETVSFVSVGIKSMEKREEILKGLMQVVDVPLPQNSDKKAIEQKLRVLSSLLESCKEARRKFISAFSEAKNPFLNSEISEALEKLIDGERHFPGDDKPKVMTLQEENAEWGNLCFLCENEIKRTQAELLKASN